MVLGYPIFIGESSVDQLIEIIKVLGTPTSQQIFSMNPEHKGAKMPNIKPMPWTKVFQNCKIDPLAIDLISKILVYSPEKRLTSLEALMHPYFDELRHPRCRINSKPLENLFNFTEGKWARDFEFHPTKLEMGSGVYSLSLCLCSWNRNERRLPVEINPWLVRVTAYRCTESILK